jgi:hypothetical protein
MSREPEQGNAPQFLSERRLGWVEGEASPEPAQIQAQMREAAHKSCNGRYLPIVMVIVSASESTLLRVLRENGPGMPYEDARRRWQDRLGITPGNRSALRFHAMVEDLKRRGVIRTESDSHGSSVLEAIAGQAA